MLRRLWSDTANTDIIILLYKEHLFKQIILKSTTSQMLQFSTAKNTSETMLVEKTSRRCTLSVVRVDTSWGPLVASELTCSFRLADPGKPRPENKVWLSMVCARSHSWCRHPRNPAGIDHTYQHDRAKTCSDTEQLPEVETDSSLQIKLHRWHKAHLHMTHVHRGRIST